MSGYPGLAIILVLGLACPCLSHASVYEKDGKLVVPKFSALNPNDGVVSEFTIKIDCAGVESIENIPDGWSASLHPDGENYIVHVAREQSEAWLAKLGIPDRTASNLRLESIRIGLIYRGQWSDCMGVHASIRMNVPVAGGGWAKSDVRLADVNVVKGDDVIDDRWESDPHPVPIYK